jgi:peptidylprolyl isomerase
MKTIRMLVVVSLLLSLASPALAQRRTRKRPARRPGTAAKKTPPKRISQQGVTTASGLTYIITHRGTGRRPQTGETVVVHYTGMLTDGTKFDSSHDRNDPFAFSLGQGTVIKGWDEGVAQLSIGDHAILIIPPELGYGARGAGGVIPANATLVFAVNLVDIK